MAKAAQIDTVSQRADGAVWKKIDAKNWKQIQDGHDTNAPRDSSQPTPPSAKGGESAPTSEWDRIKIKYDLDGAIPDASVAPEHVNVDVEGDIDSKPVLSWKDMNGRSRNSYTRTFHLQRSYALHKACKEHSQAIFDGLDKAEELAKTGDPSAVTAYATLLTGHRPETFLSATPDRVRVYRGERLEKSLLDDLIEKADTRDPKHPNRVHVMHDHPTQGAVVASFYDKTLADHMSNGGSFGDPTPTLAGIGLGSVPMDVIRHHASLRLAADSLSKSPSADAGKDFASWSNEALTSVSSMSETIARHYGHGPAPAGMSYVPVQAAVATVDELGGGTYWPGTFPKRAPYVESLAPDPEDNLDEVIADAPPQELPDEAFNEPPAKKRDIKASLVAQYLPDSTPEKVQSLLNQVDPEPPCENSPSAVTKSSSEPSPTHSPSPSVIVASGTTTPAQKSATPSPSPAPSSIQASLAPTTSRLPLQARMAFAESIRLCLEGKIEPRLVVEAAKSFVLDDPDGLAIALSKAVDGAAPKPSTGQQSSAAMPEGTVSKYKDGTIAKKVGGEWKQQAGERGKGKAPSEGKKPPADLDKLIDKYRRRIRSLKTQGASDDQLGTLRDRLSKLVAKKERRASKKASVDYFELWKSGLLSQQLQAVTSYCKSMGYTEVTELLFAITVSDTPVSVEVAMKGLLKSYSIETLNARIQGGQ